MIWKISVPTFEVQVNLFGMALDLQPAFVAEHYRTLNPKRPEAGAPVWACHGVFVR